MKIKNIQKSSFQSSSSPPGPWWIGIIRLEASAIYALHNFSYFLEEFADLAVTVSLRTHRLRQFSETSEISIKQNRFRPAFYTCDGKQENWGCNCQKLFPSPQTLSNFLIRSGPIIIEHLLSCISNFEIKFL